MKSGSLEFLCCPACHADLLLENAGERHDVETGRLKCLGCSKVYPIQEGLPRFAARQELIGKNRNQYWLGNIYSHFYDQIVVKPMMLFFGVQEEAGRREYLSELEAIKNAKVLEIAVGPGPNIPYVYQMVEGAEVYGLDLSLGMLHQCAENLNRWSLEADLFQGLAEQLPFKDNTFDVVFQVGGINDFRDKQRAIEEMLRVAKPGTKIVVVDEWLHPEREKRLLGRLVLRALPVLYRRTEPPTDLLPATVEETRLEPIWNGYGYCLAFRKPGARGDAESPADN